jgi:thioredoxin reductase (NADPH)
MPTQGGGMEIFMYDSIIIGGGPAGMSAAVYAARGGLKTLVLESMGLGGQMNYTYEVANYPGAEDNPSGDKLAARMRMQAESFGAGISNERVKQIDDIDKNIKTVITRKNIYQTKTVILATGAVARKLGAEGEDRFSGTGVSYCATCDGAFFKGQTTAVAGGGNTAFEDALYLSRFCKKVYLINRSERFRASAILRQKAENDAKIEIVKNSVITKICGDTTVKEIILKDTKTAAKDSLECSGVFIAIGREPSTSIIPAEIKRNGSGFIETDNFMRTNLPGVFAAGDVRDTPLRQIVTAAADGAVAAVSSVNYLNEWADN